MPSNSARADIRIMVFLEADEGFHSLKPTRILEAHQGVVVVDDPPHTTLHLAALFEGHVGERSIVASSGSLSKT